MVATNQKEIPEPKSDDTVLWLRLTFEHLKDIKPGSKLAKMVLENAIAYESAWRPAYVNALERNGSNPAIMVDEDAPMTERQTLDDEDGAYVMCWHFIPHSSVIPPTSNPSPKEIGRSLGRLRAVAENLEFEA